MSQTNSPGTPVCDGAGQTIPFGSDSDVAENVVCLYPNPTMPNLRVGYPAVSTILWITAALIASAEAANRRFPASRMGIRLVRGEPQLWIRLWGPHGPYQDYSEDGGDGDGAWDGLGMKTGKLVSAQS